MILFLGGFEILKMGKFLELQTVLIKCSLYCAPFIRSDSVHPQFYFGFAQYYSDVCLIFLLILSLLYESIILGSAAVILPSLHYSTSFFYTLTSDLFYFSICTAVKVLWKRNNVDIIKQNWNYWCEQFTQSWFRILLLLQMRIFW